MNWCRLDTEEGSTRSIQVLTVADDNGQARRQAHQATMWVAMNDLPRSAAHPFYTRLNQILDKHDFDRYVEGLCQRFYADDGRPRLPPGRYFRLLLIGYFEVGCGAGDRMACRGFVVLITVEMRMLPQ